MTLSEFKAWFDGYSVGIGGGPPSSDQWETVSAKVRGLDAGLLGQFARSPNVARQGTISGSATDRIKDLVSGYDPGPTG